MNSVEIKKELYTNPLGPKKIEELLLKPKPENNSISITEDDYIRSICTHRHNDHLEVVSDGAGRFRCKICGAEFSTLDTITYNEVVALTNEMINLMNTIKLRWLGIPDKTAIELFQSMVVLEKVPEMFRFADMAWNEGSIKLGQLPSSAIDPQYYQQHQK